MPNAVPGSSVPMLRARPLGAGPGARTAALRRGLCALAAVSLTLVPLLAGPMPGALADGEKDQKIAERASIDQQLDDLRIELADVNEDLAQTYLDLAETELLIPEAQQDLEDAQDELEAAREEDRQVGERLESAQEEEAQLTEEVDSGQDEVDRSDEELAEIAISAYKGSGTPNPASVYIGSESPQATVDRTMNYKLTLASQGSRLDQLREDQAVTENSADRLEAVREEIDDLKQQAEEAVVRKETAEQEAEDAKQALDDLYAQQQTQRDDLEAKKTEYEDQETSLENQGNELDDEIERLAEAERARLEREAQSSSSSSGSSGSSSGNSAGTRSGWIRPVGGVMNSTFGWRVHPIYGTRKFHAGDDFPVGCGTPVKAAHSGTVLQTTYNSSAGNKLIMSNGINNGHVITTSYHHLQGFAVSAGTKVNAGDTIAYVGTTGSSTGCHLHFEVHEDGTAVDPAGYV
ncbi:murein hydrolase activator EnvC family protein [Brachybacterium sp. DNPG3]